MIILSESYGSISSDLLMESNMSNYMSIINKVGIYNKNYSANLYEGRHYNTVIKYSVKEQEDIRDMFKILKAQLLEAVVEEMYAYSLNEGLFDNIKSGINKIKDKTSELWSNVQNWSDEKWEKIIDKVCPKFKNAFTLINELIKSKIPSAEALSAKLLQFFSKVGDRLYDFAVWMGGIGPNAITDEDDEKLDDSLANAANESLKYNYTLSNLLENENTNVSAEESNEVTKDMKADEKSFFMLLVDWVSAKLTGSKEETVVEKYLEMSNSGALNEGIANTFGAWLRKKCANNKFLSMLLLHSFNGKKAGFLKILIISLIGTAIITVLHMLAPISLVATHIYLIVGLLWGVRGVISVLAKRLTQLRPGEKLFSSKAFVISLVTTSSTFFLSVWSITKNFLHDLGVIKHADALEKIKEFMEAHGNNPSDAEVAQFLKDNPDVYKAGEGTVIVGQEVIPVDPKGLAADWSETMKGVKANKEWLQTMAEKAAENPGLLLPTDHNFATNIQYKGGLPAFVKDNMEALTDRCADLGINPQDLIKHEGLFKNYINFTSDYNGATTWGTVIGVNDGKTADFYKVIADYCKEQGVTFNFIDMGAGQPQTNVITRRFIELAAKAAPAAAKIIPFFAVFDFMNTEDGYIIASLGSEATTKKYYFVTKIEEKPIEEIAKEVKNTEGVKAVIDAETDKVKDNKEVLDNLDKDQIQKLAKRNENAKKKINALIKNLQLLSDVKDRKMAVWYGIPMTNKEVDTYSDSAPDKFEPWINEHEDKELPILLLNPYSMVGYDLASDDPKLRMNPYFFKGIQNKLTVKPLFNKDKNTKEYIAKMFAGIIAQGIDLGLNNNLKQVVAKENGKWIVLPEIENAADEPNVNFGYLTPNEICKVKNKELSPYELTQPDLAVDITTKKDGTFSVSKRYDTIEHNEKKFDQYVKNVFLPVITNKNTDVYKEIMEYANKNKNFKKIFVTEDGELNVENVLKYEFWFRRSMSAYGQQIDQTTIGNLWKKVKSKFGSTKYSQEDLQNDWKDIAAFSHIIWSYRGSINKWNKQCRLAGVREIRNSDEEVNATQDTSANSTQTNDTKDSKDTKEDKSAKSNADNSEKTGKNDNASDSKKDDKDSADNSDKNDKQSNKNKWIARFINRINKPTKSLYKELLKNKTIKEYYNLSDDADKFSIDPIKNDNRLMSTLFKRFNSAKSVSDNYWNVSLPNVLKRAIPSISEDEAKKRAKVYREIYKILNKYIRKTASLKNKRKWQEFLKEHKQLVYNTALNEAQRIELLK